MHLLPPDRVTGTGSLPSAYPVTDLAVAVIGHAGRAVAALAALDGPRPTVSVDRRLASAWFAGSLRPDGWSVPPPWDPLAGDYRTADGWIRLHTNAPHHRAAALGVLDVAPERPAVAAVVAGWSSDELETAVVAAGGAAAAMRTADDWASHPQGEAVAAEPLVARREGGAGPAVRLGPADRPLAGIRVLDLTRVLAGPVATRFLAGFGAEVLRIDPPDWDEPGVVPEVVLGKRCARLDARTPAGLAALEQLVAGADVLVHGYRPGALDHLGLGAPRRAELRPDLVEVCLDAYGWTGPWAGRRGFDSLVQMSAGMAAAGMTWAGTDVPTPLPVQALDHATGYLLAAAAVDGLAERVRTGRGSTARASLARTAALLGALGPTPDDRPHPAGEPPRDEAVEATSWGPAHRLRPPVELDGVPMRWDRPAVALGTHAPTWEATAG